MGDSKERLRTFPKEVSVEIGYALYEAQRGNHHPSAKRMKGLHAVEIVSDHDGNTFRGVYTCKFRDVVYVLHCFQKKSKSGVATPKRDLELIEQRLKAAEKDYNERIRNAKT